MIYPFTLSKRPRRVIVPVALPFLFALAALSPAFAFGTPVEHEASPPASCPLPDVPGREAASGSPNVVMIVVDTLRADHLGFLGHDRSTSPHLDRLAQESLIYERAIAPAPWTTPSVAGLVTGKHPAELGFDEDPIMLPIRVSTLAEHLLNRGYDTAGIVSHFFLGRKFRFHHGFHFWNQQAGVGHDTISSPHVTGVALACLDALAERPGPFFLFLHYFDPHYDYLGHDAHPFHVGYEGSVRSANDNFEDLRKLARADALSKEDYQHLRDLYDSEIAFTDAHIGRLIEALRAHEVYDDTLVVFVADHGEMFAERRGRWIGHTRYLYDEAVRVPLVMKLPGEKPRRGRIRQPVSLVDVLPTVLGLIDGETPTGRSLLASRRGEERPVFTQTRRWNQLDAVYLDGWKLIADRERDRYELYDLATDPGEKHDLSAAEPERRASMAKILDTWNRYNQREAAKLEGVEVPELTEEEIERLRSLGYIQ